MIKFFLLLHCRLHALIRLIQRGTHRSDSSKKRSIHMYNPPTPMHATTGQHAAQRNGRSIGVRGVHAQLEQLDIPLSFLSVREVLKRLCAEGVIQLGADKCYSLDPQARALLERTISP